ncbi:MAG: ATP-dependent Clp protease ATP-binding subunit, partial [Kiritimatiellae bacterium]|nr:ATP-dependent Clp protease ATP-binding subunit [Kiritimatiellia bacterium]
VKYTDEALECAARLSDRYLSGRYLPDKAIDVIDEAGALVRIRNTTRSPDLREKETAIEKVRVEKEDAIKKQRFEEAARLRDIERQAREELDVTVKKWKEEHKEEKVDVTADDVLSVLSKWTGVPLKKMEGGELARLLDMEKVLTQTVIGQAEAIDAISRALRRSRADLKDPKRPIGSFIFLGPTGVGKTLLAKAMAEFMFGDVDALVQLDMSEYMEKFNVSRLVGSPPGYVGYEEGGQLTEKVRRRPYSLVLFDEVEKAHPDVAHMLLQILEEGKLTDSFGRHVDFRNTVVILTSNLGYDAAKGSGGLGFGGKSDQVDYERIKAHMLEEAKRAFKPEFLNRFDDIIVFRQLNKDNVSQILDLELAKIEKRLAQKGRKLHLTKSALKFLMEKGFNISLGARPLRRAVEKYVEDPLAEEILRGRLSENGVIEVVESGDGLKFRQKHASGKKHNKKEEGLQIAG